MIRESELTNAERESMLKEARKRAEGCDAIHRDTGQSYDEKLGRWNRHRYRRLPLLREFLFPELDREGLLLVLKTDDKTEAP